MSDPVYRPIPDLVRRGRKGSPWREILENAPPGHGTIVPDYKTALGIAQMYRTSRGPKRARMAKQKDDTYLVWLEAREDA
jgi:hypothetical protein